MAVQSNDVVLPVVVVVVVVRSSPLISRCSSVVVLSRLGVRIDVFASHLSTSDQPLLLLHHRRRRRLRSLVWFFLRVFRVPCDIQMNLSLLLVHLDRSMFDRFR